MVILWQILAQFIFRLTFGMAAAMAGLPAPLVASGYYRVQLWVLMGLSTVVSLAVYSNAEAFDRGLVGGWQTPLALGVASAVLCYAGSVAWLYERRRAGIVLLGIISAVGLAAAMVDSNWLREAAGLAWWLRLADLVSSGLLLGITLAAMLLGHWYLNTPTMQLAPLRRLVVALLVAVALRAGLCGLGLALQCLSDLPADTSLWIFIAFRWLSGLLGAGLMGVLAWYTLQVPNTQSATGILYAGVILTFIGELMSQLLSASLRFPV